ncbi:MAG: transposase [Methylococcales bacterium]|nr:transposase [Methylococcales bacterium]
MSDLIKDPKLISAMQESGRGLKSASDLAKLSRELLKITVEASLNAEMDGHTGDEKPLADGYNTGNSRHGYNRKTLKGEPGAIEIETPRARNGSFEPVFVAKNQTRLTQFDDQILLLYARGMTTPDSVETFAELYGADLSPTRASQVTDAVLEKGIEWQTRPLATGYAILYLEGIVVKIRQDKRVINPAVQVAPGVNSQGHKELPGLGMAENEGARFWLSVLTELKNRGVKDVFIAGVEGLSGCPEGHCDGVPKNSGAALYRPHDAPPLRRWRLRSRLKTKNTGCVTASCAKAVCSSFMAFQELYHWAISAATALIRDW